MRNYCRLTVSGEQGITTLAFAVRWKQVSNRQPSPRFCCSLLSTLASCFALANMGKLTLEAKGKPPFDLLNKGLSG